jgi:hypothetical protein
LKETEQLKLDVEAKAKDKLAREAVTDFRNLSFDVAEEDIWNHIQKNCSF